MLQRSSSSSKRSRSSASSMASAGVPRMGRPISSMCLASLMAVCPPNCTTQASGFSVAMMLSTLSGFSGSKYRRSPVSKSVETVSGVVVDQNGLAAVLFQSPHAVHRAVVELDALTDADGAGTKDQHLFLLGLAVGGSLCLSGGNELGGLVVAVVGGVEVRSVGRELSSTGIDHLETGAVVLHRQSIHLCQTLDGLILEAVLLGGLVLFLGQDAVALGQTVLQVGRCCILSRNHQSILVIFQMVSWSMPRLRAS